MTILEQLRERKDKLIEEINAIGMFKGSLLAIEIKNYLIDSDLALENALLKLKNRGVEIKDLKHRVEHLKDRVESFKRALEHTNPNSIMLH